MISPEDAECYFESVVDSAVECLRRNRDLGGLVAEAAAAMVVCLEAGGKVMTCGNGGSAADGSHFATEFLCRLRDDRRPLPAVSLVADACFLSATANDYGYDAVFSRQIRGLGGKHDVLAAISTSGNSGNIVAALEEARACNVKSVAFLGKDGGRCRGLADIEIIVNDPSTARIQEMQMVLIHAVCSLVEHALLGMDLENESLYH